jgi:phosphoglycolate phosphatase-like HAD superfamily hydrolase
VVQFLRALKQAGVLLYLASGTDVEDVRREAERLGYSDVFEGRIYGSIGQVAKDAKKVVIEGILSEIDGAADQIVTFGDGPVEIRESGRRGAFAVGVASDELRRFGMNPEKRHRLIRNGKSSGSFFTFPIPAHKTRRIPNLTVPVYRLTGSVLA